MANSQFIKSVRKSQSEMCMLLERLLMFAHLLLNLRLKIAENGGPNGHRSRGESLASAR